MQVATFWVKTAFLVRTMKLRLWPMRACTRQMPPTGCIPALITSVPITFTTLRLRRAGTSRSKSSAFFTTTAATSTRTSSACAPQLAPKSASDKPAGRRNDWKPRSGSGTWHGTSAPAPLSTWMRIASPPGARCVAASDTTSAAPPCGCMEGVRARPSAPTPLCPGGKVASTPGGGRTVTVTSPEPLPVLRVWTRSITEGPCAAVATAISRPPCVVCSTCGLVSGDIPAICSTACESENGAWNRGAASDAAGPDDKPRSSSKALNPPPIPAPPAALCAGAGWAAAPAPLPRFNAANIEELAGCAGAMGMWKSPRRSTGAEDATGGAAGRGGSVGLMSKSSRLACGGGGGGERG
mmetsp:Transcript_44657/g.106209  ORF Transcript_44657/g.106209 Transcript_44657/m.106209 type:complete len:353 (+) Transcript_44657:188-1246(+)